MLLKEQKTAVIEKSRLHETDTGSPEVQIAILTERIATLTEHLKIHNKVLCRYSGITQTNPAVGQKYPSAACPSPRFPVFPPHLQSQPL